MPQFYYFIKRGIHIQQNLWKTKAYCFYVFLFLIPHPLYIIKVIFSMCCNISGIIQSIPPRSSCNLLYFRQKQRSSFISIKFIHLKKNDPSDRKIKSHSDRIRRDNNLRLTGVKHIHLPAAYFRRQASIYHT